MNSPPVPSRAVLALRRLVALLAAVIFSLIASLFTTGGVVEVLYSGGIILAAGIASVDITLALARLTRLPPGHEILRESLLACAALGAMAFVGGGITQTSAVVNHDRDLQIFAQRVVRVVTDANKHHTSVDTRDIGSIPEASGPIDRAEAAVLSLFAIGVVCAISIATGGLESRNDYTVPRRQLVL